jgi:hypothetical protein
MNQCRRRKNYSLCTHNTNSIHVSQLETFQPSILSSYQAWVKYCLKVFRKKIPNTLKKVFKTHIQILYDNIP